MANFEVIRLTDAFQISVELVEMHYPEALVSEVNRLWERAVAAEPWLFNGQFLNCNRFDEERLYGQFMEYKYYYAGTISKELRIELKLLPVGVMGITQCGNAFLVGRRAETVTQYRGQLEFVPSGIVDPHSMLGRDIDVRRQYFLELEEEVGISADQVESIKPIWYLLDRTEGTLEIIAAIQLKPGADSSRLALSEHSGMEWLDGGSLAEHFTGHSAEYVPVAGHLISKNLYSTMR